MLAGAARPAVRGAWRWQRLGVLAAAALCLAVLLVAPPVYVLLSVATLLAVAITLRWPLAGFCLLSFSVPWGSGFAVSLGTGQITSTDVLVAALGVAWLARSVRERHHPVVPTSWFPYTLLFLGAIALSTSQAVDRSASEREIVKWLELIVVYLAAVYLLRQRRDLQVVVASLVTAGVSQAILGYVQSILALGPAAFTHALLLRAYGTFDQPNPYAGYLNMVFPFALAVTIRTESRRERVWYGLWAFLILAAILASESRGAFLATVVASSVIVAIAASRFRAWAGLAVFAALVFAWLAQFNLVPLGPLQRVLNAAGLGSVSFTNVTNANFSAVERAAHWLAGVRMFAAHPLLGVGIGNYADAYPAYHPRGWYAALAHAHNYYINIAAEAGILGLVAYLLLVGSALWYSYASLRLVHDRFYNAALLGVLGALIATSFHNLFDVLYVHGTVALLGLLMAVVPVSLRLNARMSLESMP